MMWNLMKETMAGDRRPLRTVDIALVNDIVVLEEKLFGDHPFQGFRKLPEYRDAEGNLKQHEYLDFESQKPERCALPDLAVIGIDGGAARTDDPATSCFNDLDDDEIQGICTFLNKKRS